MGTSILAAISDFADVLYDCGVQDRTFSGEPFTWCNRHGGDELILARLDRFLCSVEWNRVFPDAVIWSSLALIIEQFS